MDVTKSNTIESESPKQALASQVETENYYEYLTQLGASYDQYRFYLQVGFEKMPYEWVLYVSPVVSQVTEVIKTIVPVLLRENVGFQIPMDRKAAKDLLNGFLGTRNIGKTIAAYPGNAAQALQLAKILIELTEPYKGPDIPGCILLGSIVYAGQNTQDKNGLFTRQEDGSLNGQPAANIAHTKAIWPFSEIRPETTPEPTKNINHKYRPVSVLKEDTRGNVFFGVYLKSLVTTGKCIIKQGCKNMASEDSGRDIQDRLQWQYDIQTKLSETIDIPKVLDLFTENETCYFVIEYINGITIREKIKKLNPKSIPPLMLRPKLVNIILDAIIKIIAIIEQLHEQGYIHRDASPENFLFTRKGKVFLIDLELAYSLVDQKPTPPFELGTPGYMSPEQRKVLTPTYKEDIYALGALMIQTLTGILPIKLGTDHPDQLFQNLNFFIRNANLSKTIANCLNQNPLSRPQTNEITQAIVEYKSAINSIAKELRPVEKLLYPTDIDTLIEESLNGLSSSPTVMHNGIWLSNKSADGLSTSLKEYSIQIEMNEGLAGILYLLARAHIAGYAINQSEQPFYQSWKTILEEDTKLTENGNGIPAGLYTGTYGIAMAMIDGIKAGLLPKTEENIQIIIKWLKTETSDFNIASGLSGCGLTLLKCRSLIGGKEPDEMLKNIATILIDAQQNNGFWELKEPLEEQIETLFSFGYGTTGITWFLLEYGHQCSDKRSLSAAQKSLDKLLKASSPTFGFTKSRKERNQKQQYNQEKILLNLIKAYEVLGENKYKKKAESLISSIHPYFINNDFSQLQGLSRLGEIYLEAHRVFNNNSYIEKAGWIANVLKHTFIKSLPDAGYWKMEESDRITAGLISGTAGIIHFLIRYVQPNKIGYRLFT